MDAIHHLLQEAAAEVGHFEGTVSSVMGDGLVAVFGVPLAHEDHARRAVLSAVGIQRRLRQPLSSDWHARSGGPVILSEHVRMTLHTGLVGVARIGAPQEQWTAAVGETTGLAVGMQHVAEPGSIVLSDATARFVTGIVGLEAIGPTPIGGHEPMLVHRLTGGRPRPSPLERMEARSLSPFVGRDREMSMLHDMVAEVANATPPQTERRLSQFVGRADDLTLLQALWTKGEAGRGQVVGVVGEPGMGKSRLVYEFRHSLASTRVRYLEGRCLSYGTSTPYLPIMDLVRSDCGIQDMDEPAVMAEKVGAGLREVGLQPDEHAAYVLHMLGVPDAATVLTRFSPEVIKARTFETLRTWALARSHMWPIIIAIEDLHWIDRVSEEYLATLVDSLAGAPILLLCSWRPGYRPPWVEHSYVSQLALRPLSPKDSLRVVGSVLQSEHMMAPLVHGILQRAEGNPFFLEELARAVVDRGDLRPDQLLPDTIQGVLAARVDRLSDTPRRVLQSASVIGRQFTLRLLSAIWDEPSLLAPALQELERLEFIYEQNRVPEAGFSFKHALTQEAAYASVSRNRRRQIHERIGCVLVEQFPEVADAHPELLAHHFTEAGLDDIAIGYWQRAGDRAAERSANLEAISHFRMALKLLASLPESPERTRRELGLQIALGGPLIATRGYGAPETVATYTRSLELADSANEPDLLFPLLYRRWVTHNIWAQHAVAQEAAEQFLNLAERQPRKDLRMMGHRILGTTLMFCGQLAAARAQFEDALELYDPRQDRALAYRYGQEPRAAILVGLALTLWFLGSEERAVQIVEEAIAYAREVGHTHTLAYALIYGGTLVHQLRRDPRAVAEHAEAGLNLARENQLSMFASYAAVGLGWARAVQDGAPDAVSSMRVALDELDALGARLLRPHLLGWLADGQGRCGMWESGLQTLDDALSTVELTGEHWCEAGLHLLTGEFLSAQSGSWAEAQNSFRRAVDIARAHGSVALERQARRKVSTLRADVARAGWYQSDRRSDRPADLRPNR